MSETYGGRLEGRFDVDGNGAATYAIPVIVPPGTAGLQPSLQLAHNSHLGGLGPLGAGWRLGGLSSITRVAATIAQDGFIGRVEYGAADRFALDGARLMAMEGDYGAPAAVYRTEVEQWMKVVPSGNSFIAYGKDRTRHDFGGTEDSRIAANTAPGKPANPAVRTWLVNRITDRNGNYMTIQYDRDLANNNAYPSVIKYGGNERTGAAPQREVRFSYTALPADSPDLAPQFIGGYSWANTRLLQSISTYVNGELVLTYSLAYARDSVTRRSRLTGITLADAAGRALPATTFTWQDGAASLFGPASTAPAGPEVRGTFLPMDVNGDGLVDIVNAYSVSGQLKLDLYLGRLDGTFEPPVSIPVSGLAYDQGTMLLPLDIDADGCTDLVHARGQSGELVLTVFHARQAAGGWTLEQGTPGAGGPKGLPWPGVLVALDFDGDGRIDLVHARGERNLVIRPLRSDGTKFVQDAGTTTVTDLPWHDEALLMAIDFDGDGKGDLAYARAAHNQLQVRLLRSDGRQFHPAAADADIGEVPFTRVLFPMDANGDGKPDLVAARIEKGVLQVRTMLSNGNTLEQPQLSTFPVKADAMPRLMPARLTGGPPDLIVQTIESDKVNLRVFSSNGGTFVERSGVTQPFTATWTNGTLLPADIDGDGRTDLLLIGRASSTDRRLAFTSSRVTGAIPDLVRRITDGYGEQVTIEYKPLTDSAVYRKADIPAGANADPRALLLRGISGSTFDLIGGGASIGATHSTMNVQFAKQVVSAHERPGSGTQRFRFERFYAGARVDLEGRGWLGFSRIEIVDRNRDAKRVTTYRQDFPFGASPKSAELRRAGDDRLFERITYEYREQVRGKVHEPQLVRKQRAVFGGPNASTDPDLVETTEMDYDDYGNLKLEASQTTGAQNKPLFVHHLFGDIDLPSWRLGLERESKRTSDRAGEQVLSHRKFQYDARANRISDEVWDDSHKRFLQTKTTHDDYGNPTSSTTASGAKTTTDYDPVFNTFPLRSTGPANGANVTLVVDQTFDPRFGAQLTASQPHLPDDRAPRTKSKQELDGLGRVVAALGPGNSPGSLVTLKKTSRGRDAGGPFEEEQIVENWEGTLWRKERKYLTPDGKVFQARVLGPDGTRETVVDRLFDSDGRTLEETVVRYDGTPARTVRKTYDLLSRMIRLERPLPGGGSSTAETKCLSATVEESTEGVGTQAPRTTLREYGYFGGKRSIVRRVDALGGETKFEYDALARSVRSVDPKGVVTLAAYDSADRQISLEVRDGNMVQGSDKIEYDDVKRQSVSTDARGVRMQLDFDALGRLVKRGPEGGEATTYVYDDSAKPNTLSRLARVTLPGGVHFEYDYDDHGNRTLSTLTIDGATHTMRCSYTPSANIDRLTYPDGTAVRNVYNAAGSLVAVDDAQGARQYAAYDDFSPFGKAQAISLGNGTRESLTYNDVGQLARHTITGKTGDDLARTTIHWNELYQLEQIEDGLDPKRTQTFTYDKVGRLLRATGDYEDQVFRYDPAGNLTEKGGLKFEVAGHQVRSGNNSAGTEVFRAEYDAAGNMTGSTRSGVRRAYRFDAQSQLVESNGTTFLYDHEGVRLAKKSANGAATYYIGPNFEITKFPDGARQRTAYIMGGHGIVASVTTSETAAPATTLQGVPAPGIYFFHTNHINSTTIQTDANGGEICRVEYLPFGEIHRITGRDIFRQKFTGNELDYETGLYYFKSRYYDPSIGRFISADDRLGGALDRHDVFNRYAYVLNNPVSEFDPEGHSLVDFMRTFKTVMLGVAFGVAIVAGVALTVGTGGMAASGVSIGLSVLGGILLGFGMGGAGYMVSHAGKEMNAERAFIEAGMGAACGVLGTGVSSLGLKLAGVALKFGEVTAGLTAWQALAIAGVELASGAAVSTMSAMLQAAADHRALDAGDIGIKAAFGAAGGLVAGGVLAGSIRNFQSSIMSVSNAEAFRAARNPWYTPVADQVQGYAISRASNEYVNQALQGVLFNGPRGAFSKLAGNAAAHFGPQTNQ